MAVFFTQDRLDDDGLPGPGQGVIQLHRHLRARAAFQHLVRAEGIRRGADHVRQLTVIGDGAAWIWNLAAATFPEATHIVDLYHAGEHLHSPHPVPGVHAAETTKTSGSRPRPPGPGQNVGGPAYSGFD